MGLPITGAFKYSSRTSALTGEALVLVLTSSRRADLAAHLHPGLRQGDELVAALNHNSHLPCLWHPMPALLFHPLSLP